MQIRTNPEIDVVAPGSGSVVPMLPRPVLHREVVARLRQRIVEGSIAPGAKLNERALSEELRVSRTPLREAIKMLAAEGLVELLPNRGAVAAQMQPQEVGHTFDVIAGLEGLSGEWAAERATAQEIDEIRALNYEMLAAYTRRDLPTYYRINARIHECINLAARNPVLTHTYNTVNARLQALRFRSNFDERKWKLAVDEHADMVERLASRDAAGLRAVLVAHLNHKRDVVLGLLQRGELQAVAGGST